MTAFSAPDSEPRSTDERIKVSVADAALPLSDGSHPLLFPLAETAHHSHAGEMDSTVGAREIHFFPRTLIFLEGDVVESVYQVVEGVVMLYKLLPDGRRQVVELLAAGDVFGFSALTVHDCSAETLVATRCMVLDRVAIERSPVLMRRLSLCLYAQLYALHEHALLLGRKTAIERIASFIMRCLPGRGRHKCPGPQLGDDSGHIVLAMTRQEIADYLGITIETVSRTFTKLKRRNIVSISKLDDIRIHDVCRLCRLTGTHLTHGRWCSSRQRQAPSESTPEAAEPVPL